MRSYVTGLVCGLSLLFLVPGLAFAQSGTITGTVTGSDTEESLPGASVQILETDVGTAADVEGQFRIEGVSPGEKTLRISFVGYRPVERVVNVSAGETTTVNVELNPGSRRLDEVVVTGVTAETPQANLSFKVDQVSSDALDEAPASSPIGSLQGKIAGAQIIKGSGAPGSGFDVRLRGGTSISGSNQPLYIVDGVILDADQVDVNSLDIKNIEVVKGAAASSLYGSRAQAGVVNITTKRGTDQELGTTRVTVRSEFGVQSLENQPTINEGHAFPTNDQGQIVDDNENPINYQSGVGAEPNGPNGTIFYNQSYEDLRKVNGEPYELFDPFDQIFNPGNTTTQFVAVSQNNEQTNFRLSFEDTREQGPIQGEISTEGYERQNYRLNLDHRPNDQWSVSASGAYASSTNDDPQLGDDSPFFDMMFTIPLADLTERDDAGELKIQGDPNAVEANPLYPIENAQLNYERSRFMGNVQVEYSPIEWADVSGQLSYDRLDRRDEEFYDVGYRDLDNPQTGTDGEIERFYLINNALNADLTSSFAQEFGDWTLRSQLKGQIERTSTESDFVQGTNLTAGGVTSFDGVDGERSLSSTIEQVNSEAYYLTASGDYDSRYIFDFLVRRDGSSLFGADERWQTYYRAAGAYRIAQEDFWPAPNTVTDFKLRYSYGTAGGRPPFSARFETYDVSGIQPTKQTKGNADLKPEFQIEQELGAEVSFFDRVFLDVTYADTEVDDQILRVPLPGAQGFQAQWRNAGTIEATTWEASLDADITRTRDFNWRLGVNFDRTRQEVTNFDANPIRVGPSQQKAFFIREGETLGAMYGEIHVNERSQLEEMGLDPAAFDKNDDGYWVPVGEGNSWQDGFNEDACAPEGCWGTTVTVDGQQFDWGMPIQFEDSEGETFHKIGDTNPDFNLGLSTNLNYKGFSFYSLVSAQIGGDIYNATRQWGTRDNRSKEVDQTDKPQERQKPQSYYQTLYSVNSKNNHFVEDGTFWKIREMSVGYTFDQGQLNDWIGEGNFLNQINLRLVGRNLFTFTDYSGVDPEIAGGTAEGDINSDGTIYRIDNFEYPKFRTITGRIELQF